jgi:hypothetical protein
MKFDQRGKKQINGRINSFAEYLDRTKNCQLWEYMGLTVEIDPSVNFNDDDVLIRWTDMKEGFNDKILFYSLPEFEMNFRKIDL